MKNYLKFSVLIILLSVFVFAGRSFAADLKVGKVDIETVFQQYHKTAENKKKYEQEQNKQQAEITKRQDKIKQLNDAYEKQKDTLSADAKQTKENEIKKESEDLLTFAKNADQALETQKNKIVSETLKDINAAIKDLALKGKYDLILDSTAVLYAPEGTDLTQQVLGILNKGYAASDTSGE